MKRHSRTVLRILPAAALAGLLAVTACAPRDGRDTVAVGSKEFTEQLILGEMMALLIEERTELRVVRRLNLGGTMICHTALTRGDIDLYAEYTGTALTAILDEAATADPDAAFETVKQAYARRFDCTWLTPFGFNNTYTLTIDSAFAAEHGVTSIGDLEELAGGLTAGFTAEFAVREDGYPGLQAAYGFRFGENIDMDPGLMYRAVDRGEVDVICAFATDGRIAAYDLTTLDDNKGFFPPYYAAPVVRNATLAAHPELRDVLERLAGLLDDDTMRRLNLEVDEYKREPAEVARDFLIARELVPAQTEEK